MGMMFLANVITFMIPGLISIYIDPTGTYDLWIFGNFIFVEVIGVGLFFGIWIANILDAKKHTIRKR